MYCYCCTFTVVQLPWYMINTHDLTMKPYIAEVFKPLFCVCLHHHINIAFDLISMYAIHFFSDLDMFDISSHQTDLLILIISALISQMIFKMSTTLPSGKIIKPGN